MLYFRCKSHISRWVLAAHKNNQCSGISPSVLKDCFWNIDYFHFTTSGTSFLRQINIPRPMISRGPFTTPTTTPNHYCLPTKSTYLPSNTFLPFLQLFVYLEYRRNRNRPVKDDKKIASQMKVYYKLISLGQRQYYWIKTADAYLWKQYRIIYGYRSNVPIFHMAL